MQKKQPTSFIAEMFTNMPHLCRDSHDRDVEERLEYLEENVEKLRRVFIDMLESPEESDEEDDRDEEEDDEDEDDEIWEAPRDGLISLEEKIDEGFDEMNSRLEKVECLARLIRTEHSNHLKETENIKRNLRNLQLQILDAQE